MMATRQKTTEKKTKVSSRAAARTVSRHIPEKIKVLLAALSAGRCEFRGCNEYLFEHPLTLEGGNFSEKAHIYPFGNKGPRSDDGSRPADVHAIENLLVLCQACHKLVDDNPKTYTREILEEHKKEHEDRVRYVTGLGPEMRTSVVQLKSRIGGDAVDIPANEICEAIAPRYPAGDKEGTIIDLTTIRDDRPDEYYRVAERQIRQSIDRLYEPGMSVDSTRHISLFALTQIPLLVHLGRCLSNKIPVDFYQRHRDQTNPWKWPEDEEPVRYKQVMPRKGTDRNHVALTVSLSGQISLDSLPERIDESFFVYDIGLDDRKPGTDFLRKRQDLDEFRRTYRGFLSDLMASHPSIEELHLFPAVPAPTAITLGHDLLPKVHPVLIVYDWDKRGGGFIRRIRVNDHDN
jgi:SMODS-associated and fused to various effectors sensor domain/HNH endonuclease